MNHIRRINLIGLLLMLLCMAGCDKYLDALPDKRAEVDNNRKVAELLVSAYPTVDPMMIYEHRTDNVMDNGKLMGTADRMLEENYFWKDISQTEWDAPEQLWGRCYYAIAACNHALDVIDKLGVTDENKPLKAEALMCRAYAHFLLVNTFSQPYDAKTAGADMGFPYVKEMETSIGKQYDRGTVQSTYEQIDQDIEAAYPDINDNAYAVPLFHFNKRASAAFAARFNLYYGRYEKALTYANEAIGEDPRANLRNFNAFYHPLNNSSEWRDRFISKEEPANLLLVALRSRWGRRYTQQRYGHSDKIASACTYRSKGPWGSILADLDLLYGISGKPVKFQPKYNEIFEVTNQTAQTGQPHVVQMAFTVDETLLVRAEAEVMLHQYDQAARDLSYWYVSKGGQAAKAPQIIQYYTALVELEKDHPDPKNPDRTVHTEPWLRVVKPFHAHFAIEPGDQEMMLQAVLHARRIETLFSGLRWLDIRRYGIEVVHKVADGDPITLAPDDPRRVIQIPLSVTSAGMPQNPTTNK